MRKSRLFFGLVLVVVGCASQTSPGVTQTDAGASSDAAETSGVSLARLLPIDGTTLFDGIPKIQIMAQLGALPAGLESSIHLAPVGGGADVDVDVTLEQSGGYSNIAIAPTSGPLSGSYVLQVDSLPAGYAWFSDQFAAGASGQSHFTTGSAAKANLLRICGKKVEVEYSEKMLPPPLGSGTVSTDSNSGCTLQTSADSIDFQFACEPALDTSAPIHFTAASLPSAAGSSAPAVDVTLTVSRPVDNGCLFEFIR